MFSIWKRQRATALSLGVAAAFTVAYALWLALRIGGEPGLRYLSDVAFQLPPMAASIACLIAAWRSRGRERLGWAAFAAGLASWSAAEWIWSGYDLFFRAEPPLLSAADPFYYLAYPLVIGAIALLVTPPRGSRLDAKSSLDALLLMTVLAVIAWEWLLTPIYEHTDASKFELFVVFGYPAADLALLAAIILTFYRARGALSVPALLLVAGAVMMTASDGAYLYAATVTGYDVFGNPLELGWVVSYFAFGIAAVAHAESLPQSGAERPRLATGARGLRVLGLALPYAALVPLAALNLYDLLNGAPDTALVAGMIAAIALVAARQFLTLRELADSHETLEGLNAQLQESMGIEHHLARTDALTGIPNRRFVDELLDAEILRANRYGGHLALAMADVDALKAINDTYGHEAGDEVLRYVAQRARESCRNVDIVGRYGGDEFVFVLVSTGCDDASAFAERFRRRLMDAPATTRGKRSLRVSVSLGVAPWDAASMKTAAELIRQADRAMYAAKAGGRNRTMVATGDAARAA